MKALARNAKLAFCLSSAVFVFFSALSQAPAADPAPQKPRINGWLALYDLARRKGTYYPNHGGIRELPPASFIWVPTTTPGRPISGDTCEIHATQAWIAPDMCPGCGNIPGFDPRLFELSYNDKGCTGKLANFRWVPVDGISGEPHTPAAVQRYMQRWLTPAVFDYLGLLYLQYARGALHTE